MVRRNRVAPPASKASLPLGRHGGVESLLSRKGAPLPPNPMSHLTSVAIPHFKIIAAYAIFFGSYIVFAIGKFPGMKIDRPGAAIIGAPFTMVFLVLESTGDFLITFATLMGVLIASTTVRLTFGYSFSTWRFHLRGLPLRGGHDIGWITEMTAGRLMRSDVRTVPVATPLGKLRELVPLGSHKWAVAVNGGGEYAGMIDIAAVHDPDITEMVPHLVAADLTTCRGCYVLPGDDIRTILRKFGEARAETLPVVASATAPRVLGSLSEAFALKRYTQELERRRNDELGMPGL